MHALLIHHHHHNHQLHYQHYHYNYNIKYMHYRYICIKIYMKHTRWYIALIYYYIIYMYGYIEEEKKISTLFIQTMLIIFKLNNFLDLFL